MSELGLMPEPRPQSPSGRGPLKRGLEEVKTLAEFCDVKVQFVNKQTASAFHPLWATFSDDQRRTYAAAILGIRSYDNVYRSDPKQWGYLVGHIAGPQFCLYAAYGEHEYRSVELLHEVAHAATWYRDSVSHMKVMGVEHIAAAWESVAAYYLWPRRCSVVRSLARYQDGADHLGNEVHEVERCWKYLPDNHKATLVTALRKMGRVADAA